MTKQELLKDLQIFIDNMDAFILDKGIDISKMEIDHICYKCASSEEFENIKRFFEFEDKFIYQSIISKRRLAYIGLAEPLHSKFGDIFYFELSDQKPDGSQKSEVEHLEFVPEGISYEEMVNLFKNGGFLLKENIKPNHTVYEALVPGIGEIKLSHERLVHTIYKKEFVLG